MSSARSIAGRIVAAATRRPRIVVAGALLLAVAATLFVVARFSVHTELAALIPKDTPWRVEEAKLEEAFAQQRDEIVIVIDGETPELAEDAADRLAGALEGRKDLFHRVARPSGGPFLTQEALLFDELEDVRRAVSAIIAAQPLLGPLAADPSLRGVLNALSTGAEAAASGNTDATALSRPVEMLDDVAGRVEADTTAFISWRDLLGGGEQAARDRRQFVAVTPGLDYSRQDPAARALAEVRLATARLGLDEAHGVRVRYTGEVAMEHDELATLEEAVGPIAGVALLLTLGVLFAALRSWRAVLAVVVTVLAGLALTAAFGLAAYGRFNLISIAFLPLFAGLGVDFAVQFCVRYRAETLVTEDIRKALIAAGDGAGHGLVLAAAALGVGFFAFWPTRYSGMSQLGAISGVGMLIALVLSLALLPALLQLLSARSPAAEAGLPAFRRLDAWIFRRRSQILIVALLAGLGGLALAPHLAFDFDPLNLRNPHRESVATYLELARDPETAPDAVDVLAPDMATARPLAARLARLPQVRQVITADSLVPPDQAAKLAIIRDAADLLGPTLDPFDVAAPPTDAEEVDALNRAAAALKALADRLPAAEAGRARALAEKLDAAAAGPPQLRARLQTAVVAGLPRALSDVRAALSARPVDLASLPPEVRSDWIAPDGRARLEVLPRAQHGDVQGLADFTRAVTAVAPRATGSPVAIAQTRALTLNAFANAGGLALAGVLVLLGAYFRNARDVLLTIAPVILSALLTVAFWVLVGRPINLENMIALPLMIGVGVSFNIYIVVAWRRGERLIMASSLARAIVFSGLTTGAAFGALALSQHPGTASMGGLLLISLFWTLIACIFVQPALLGRFRLTRGSSFG